MDVSGPEDSLPGLSIEPSEFSEQDLIPDRALRDADIDAFDHRAIARNLARHVEFAEGPLNIALYGAWGSGKSSAFKLLQRELEGRAVEAVHYDAWRFAGDSLQRNFISHAANELQLTDPDKDREFHEGLFEAKRQAEVDLTDLHAWKSPAQVFGAILVGLLFTVTLIAFAVSYLTDRGPLAQIGATLSGFFIPAAVGALVVAAGKAVLDGASVSVEQSRPSSEDQFSKKFDQLVERAQERHAVKRLVFFIDELDRCSPGDVVNTLTAVKTFFDRKDCVFIVAADRQVLEEALTSDLKQRSPADQDHPYYSSASAFLDKIFHHQTHLPPLRPVSLTRFARDCVIEREGLWAEIRESGGQRQLDSVIYTLIPSHVVSPRRVKVLLNNFASNARIAGARGIAWQARVAEIAVLSVLQTEFPGLARDLPDAPDLPALLLGVSNGTGEPSETAMRLLRRHRLDDDRADSTKDASSAGDEPPASQKSDPDPIVAAVSDASRRAIQNAQRRNLRRYLERCQARGITFPRRDLWHLGGVGPLHGLTDQSLAERLETDAREAPDRIREALRGRSVEDVEASTKILADLSRHEFGDERVNCVVAMLYASRQLEDPSEELANRVALALEDFLAEDELPLESCVAGALIATSATSPEATVVMEKALKNPELLGDAARVEALCGALPQLPEDSHEPIMEAVSQHAPGDPDVLCRSVASLPDEFAADLVVKCGEVIRGFVLGTPDEADADESDEAKAEPEATRADVVEEIYGLVADKPQAAQQLQWQLFRKGAPYEIVRRHSDAVMDTINDRVARNSHALRGLEYGPDSDAQHWAKYLDPDCSPMQWWSRSVATTCSRFVRGAEVEDEVLVAVSPFMGRLDGARRAPVVKALTEALAARDWWESAQQAEEQAGLHRTAKLLGSAEPDGLFAQECLAVSLGDVARLGGDGELDATVVDTREKALALGFVGVELPLQEQLRVRKILMAVLTAAEPTTRSGAANGIVRLSAAIAETDPAAGRVLQSKNVAKAIGRSDWMTVSRWLDLGPEPGVVVSLGRRLLGTTLADWQLNVLTRWARSTTESQRTDAAVLCLDRPSPGLAWVRRICAEGIDETRLVGRARELVRDDEGRAVGRAPERRSVVDLVIGVQPGALAARREVAALIEDLLELGTGVDFKMAEDLVPTLGTNHQSGARLREAFDRATRANPKLRITPKGAAALEAAGIQPKKRSLSDKALGALKTVGRLGR